MFTISWKEYTVKLKVLISFENKSGRCHALKANPAWRDSEGVHHFNTISDIKIIV